MNYIEDFARIKGRYQAFWEKENESHIVSIVAPRVPNLTVDDPKHASLEERWCDVEYMLKKTNAQINNTYYGGDAFPLAFPDLGPDQFASFYGTPLIFGETTSWAEHIIHDSNEFKKLILDKQSFYYKKLYEMLHIMVEDAKDRYFVGIPDLHPGADGLVSLRGPQELCIDTFENPGFILNGVMDLFDGFQEVYNEMYQITTKYQEGSSSWVGIWHPGKWFVTSCDFCCMISKEMFEKFIIPELMKELEFLDASIFHLDGPGALQHLDRLLEIDKLKGVQWVYGAGAPPAPEWLAVIKKIQKAGKIVQIDVLPKDLKFMIENTNPKGMMFRVYPESLEEGMQLDKMIKTMSK